MLCYHPQNAACNSVPPDALGAEFDRYRPHIAAALERDFGTHSIDDVREEVVSGRAHLWTTPQSATVTRVEFTPQNTMLCIWLSGGDLDDLRAVEPQISAWARAHYCDLIYISGRRGWLRSLDGYAEAASVMVKQL